MIENPAIYNAKVLLVDENASRLDFLQHEIKRTGYLRVLPARSRTKALHWCRQQDPNVVVLSLGLKDSHSLVSELRGSYDGEKYVPILVFSEVEDQPRILQAIRSGASDFVTKASSTSEIILRMTNLLEARSLVERFDSNDTEMQRVIEARTRELVEQQIEILQRLGRASEYRDDDTGEHTKRVGHMSALIAEALGLCPEEVELIRLAAPLHDIGKIGIRDAVLMKPGTLTESEYAVMKTHAIIGSRILDGGRSPLLQMAELIARSHHERWDGSGYPNRLRGEEIPLPGRIVAVADVFDALTSKRPYKEAWPIPRAVDEIKAQSGKHFDPGVVEAFLKIVSEDLNFSEAA